MSSRLQSPPQSSQDATNAIRSFNRFELKYLLTSSQANAFREDLVHHVDVDPHAGPAGSYPLASLYYDTADFRFYWEKLDGIKFRRKLRIRSYDPAPAPSTMVFAEIKQRVNRVTQKRRIVAPLADALALCGSGVIPEHDPRDSATYEEIAAMTLYYDLAPTVITLHERQAFVGRQPDPGLRITFDKDIRYRTDDLDLASGAPGWPAINPSWEVRVEALLRRSGGVRRPTTELSCADLVMNDAQHRVARGDDEISLSPVEYRLLRYLLSNVGQVLSRAQILEAVWGYEYGDSVIETAVSQLRKKVDEGRPKLIHTVRGFGYSLRPPGP